MKKNMLPQTNPHYAAIAQEILAKKEFVNYYTVECQKINGYEVYGCDVPLSEQEVAELRSVLAGKENKELDYLTNEISFYEKIEKIAHEEIGECELGEILIDHPIHKMSVTAVSLPSAAAEPVKWSLLVPIEDEEYLQLLAWRLANRQAPFQRFAGEHPDLFCKISNSVENQITPDPYVLYLKEIDADIFDAMGEPDLNYSITNPFSDKFARLDLQIKEKQLRLIYQFDPSLDDYCQELCNINAIEVQQAYNVSNYLEMGEKIFQGYDWGKECDVFSRFEQFLKDQNISYQKVYQKSASEESQK